MQSLSQDGGPSGSSSTPSEGEWITGRWSPEGWEVQRRRGALISMQEVWFQASGACAWRGEFAKFGDIPLLMAGGKTPLKLHKNESDLEAVKMEKSKETIRAEPYIGPPSTATTLAVVWRK